MAVNHQYNKDNDNKDNGHISGNLKDELYNMIKMAVMELNSPQTAMMALKNRFDRFKNNGYEIKSSNFGTWILKSSDNHHYIEFNGLSISAEYQIFPLWEIGKKYCILKFYGAAGSVEYIIKESDGQMRISRRP